MKLTQTSLNLFYNKWNSFKVVGACLKLLETHYESLNTFSSIDKAGSKSYATCSKSYATCSKLVKKLKFTWNLYKNKCETVYIYGIKSRSSKQLEYINQANL